MSSSGFLTKFFPSLVTKTQVQVGEHCWDGLHQPVLAHSSLCNPDALAAFCSPTCCFMPLQCSADGASCLIKGQQLPVAPQHGCFSWLKTDASLRGALDRAALVTDLHSAAADSARLCWLQEICTVSTTLQPCN